MCVRQETYGKSLCLSLNFTVNLKFLLKKQTNKQTNKNSLMCLLLKKMKSRLKCF